MKLWIFGKIHACQSGAFVQFSRQIVQVNMLAKAAQTT